MSERSQQALIRGRGNQSCGCKRKNVLRPYEALYNKLVYCGKRAGWPVEFTYEQFVPFTEQDTCHYCWRPVKWTETNLLKGSAYNLDRKDNATTYTLRNCVVCCERCNKAKSDKFSYEEWYGMTEWFRKD